jgi:spectrin beta
MHDKLHESLKYFQFIQDCDDLKEWLDMKSLQAQDDTYRDTANIHTKYLRHQAFQAEITSNKERLLALKRHAELLKEEHRQQIDPNLVDQRINELDELWLKLEDITREKGERLFDANRPKLFQQSINNLDEFMLNIEKHLYAGESTGGAADQTDGQMASTLEPLENNLTATNLLLLKQTTIEEELLKRQQQVNELRIQADKLKQLEPEKSQEIDAKRLQVEEKFSKLLLPLEQKKLRLEQQKHLHQYLRDIEDEQIWLSEKRHLLQTYADLIFNNKQQTLMNIQLLKRKNESLLKEIENHEQRLLEHLQNECTRISQDYPTRAQEFQQRLEQLSDNYIQLKETIKQRREHLELLENVYQYYYDLSEAEAWLGEQELYMMSEERGKDELSTQTFIRKQQTMEQTIENYSDILRELGDKAKNLIQDIEQSTLARELIHEHHDLINKRQTQLDKLYASLKDLSVERRQRLEETLKLYRLNREIDDLEQWISDRELIAGSHELGQDFEHVSMLLDRFAAFAHETEQIGNERLQHANEMIDLLISNGHVDSAQIAELKDSLNESYQDLLELIETRLQSLKASWELQKFLHDCKEILLSMQERKNAIPDEIGRDQQSVQQLLRKHQQFETELVLLAQDIQRIQLEAKRLHGRYAGEKEAEIKQKEIDVLQQWKLLQQFVDQRKRLLNDYEDLHRFFNLARDLNMWMDGMIRQMNNSSKPHDVSGVDLLMNNHQSLKAEIDARQENFTMCINLGKDLINRRHARSTDVKDKCVQLSMLRDRLEDTWHERWEYLQLILEVYQFARDAAIAETWLIAQESYLANEELGETLDQVENLIKRHEQFEKSLMAQEDRFNALRNLTTLEKKRQLPPVEPRKSRLPIYLDEFKTWEERDAERPSASTDKSKVRSTITEQRSVTDSSGRPTTLPGKQRLSQEYESSSKQRRSESAPRLPTIKEGFLSRKHEWEGHERKATHRAWEKFYCALTSNRLSFYKDAKHLKTGRTVSEDLNFDSSTNASQATDYKKKLNVFRLKLSGGNEYLFHAKDDLEMNEWITSINNLISSLSTIVTSTTQIPSVALTSPPTVLTSSPRQSQQQQQQQQLPTMTTSSSGNQILFLKSKLNFIL